jgi:hypothetical protein
MGLGGPRTAGVFPQRVSVNDAHKVQGDLPWSSMPVALSNLTRVGTLQEYHQLKIPTIRARIGLVTFNAD